MNILREGACSYMHVYFKLENTTRIYKGKRQSTEIKSTMKFEHAFCFFFSSGTLTSFTHNMTTWSKWIRKKACL